MKKLTTLLMMIIVLACQGQIIDHTCIDVGQIPTDVIEDIKQDCKFTWAGTSHGHQPLTGMKLLEQENSLYDVTIGDGTSGYENGGFLPPANGTFCVMDGLSASFSACGKCCTNIASIGYWEGANCHQNIEKTIYTCYPDINISGFGWCTELGGYSSAQVQTYLNKLAGYNNDYPGVTFIYSTGTAEGTGSGGHNRWLRNNQIRQYCIDNNQICFDFADLECWSNGDFSYYIHNGDTVPTQHPDYDGDTHHHTNALNCKNKGKAVWYMMAIMKGWNPQPPVNNPPEMIYEQIFPIAIPNIQGTYDVGTIDATDPDGDNISFVGEQPEEVLLNPLTGFMQIEHFPILPYTNSYSYYYKFKVIGTDDGIPPLSDSAIITIRIKALGEKYFPAVNLMGQPINGELPELYIKNGKVWFNN